MKRIIFISLILFFLLLAGLGVKEGFYSAKNPNFTQTELFSVERNQSLSRIAQNLEDRGLIRSKNFFWFYARLKGFSRHLQSGIYLLSPSMSISEIARKIASGEVATFKVTIPEGFTVRQIEERISKNSDVLRSNLGTIDLHTLKVEDFKNEFWFLKDVPDQTDLEGFLFPDTYQFSFEARSQDIARKMLKNFGREIAPDLKEEIKKQGKSVFEVVIMASLIEKEVRDPEDKKLVSGIFWKRIKQKELLASCASIAYILGKESWSFEEMRKEIGQGKKIDSPYNTYRHLGLPPGPICNPGLDSILASLYPKDSEYWYFLSTVEGDTIFSKTLREHNSAKAKYFK